MLVAINPALMSVFPPFEFVAATAKAGRPGCKGFNFVFADDALSQWVTPILYIEVTLILINRGPFCLVFRRKGPQQASAKQITNSQHRPAPRLSRPISSV